MIYPKHKWASEWKASPRGSLVAKYDSSTPSKRFLSAISQPELSQESASHIAQFHLTYVPVNYHLKRCRAVDNTRCPACGADEETIAHFLLQYLSYAHKRWALVRTASKLSKCLTLETLLGTAELAIPLANYINATHRFKVIL
jgi:hypothetical protein